MTPAQYTERLYQLNRDLRHHTQTIFHRPLSDIKARALLTEFGELLDAMPDARTDRITLVRLIPHIVEVASRKLSPRSGTNVYAEALVALAEKFRPHPDLHQHLISAYAAEDNIFAQAGFHVENLAAMLEALKPGLMPYRPEPGTSPAPQPGKGLGQAA